MARPSGARIAAGLSEGYERLKKALREDAKTPAVAELIADFTSKALDFLADCNQIPLVSKVRGKTYFSFTQRRSEILSRAVNAQLFNPNARQQLRHLTEGTLANLEATDRSRLLYTIAIAYCCASDLLRTRDRKTPATFFECLIGHLFA